MLPKPRFPLIVPCTKDFPLSIYSLQLHAFGQPSYFSSPTPLQVGDKVIVREEDDRLCMATVLSGPWSTISNRSDDEFPLIYRTADEKDLFDEHENRELAADARSFCRSCIKTRQLEMKLVDVEVFFDRSKIIFFFTAPTRIDFRELVKDLVRRYHTRIELRQIGVRHETQMVGAIGNCGMICCCRRYLRRFAPVTIKMAKEQNLFLNPAKISGSCGRLLCCLAYEQENYDNFFGMSPKVGKRYRTRIGECKVVRLNMFRNTVSYVRENNEEKELVLEDWLALNPERVDAVSGNETEQTEAISDSDALYDGSFSFESIEGDSDSPQEQLYNQPVHHKEQPHQRKKQEVKPKNSDVEKDSVKSKKRKKTKITRR
ncbi:MAG: hypothetical protein K5657_05940 [Desulfovibrio sp.]|nr:hypothetical protein [Desulfovibrio sp.]